MSRTAMVERESGGVGYDSAPSRCPRASPEPSSPFTFYEFFAGGGMARLGLGEQWTCVFANDNCPKKAASYKRNFRGTEELTVGDIRSVRPDSLPGRADLMWGSFPCQDLSLAGQGAGLKGKRSGTFWPFVDLVSALRVEHRAPRIVVLENVVGTLTSHGGADFTAIMHSLAAEGYVAGAVVGDSIHFVPQSRPRLFVVAVATDVAIPDRLKARGPSPLWHPKSLRRAYDALPPLLWQNWIWWNLPAPPDRRTMLEDILEQAPANVRWHSQVETKRLVSLMSECNLQKLRSAQEGTSITVGALYKRTRRENGEKRQRAEVRFDGVSGCLRTPAGGSSRQTLVLVEGDKVRSRLLSPREAARLMGVPDGYQLPENYNEAYHLMGDGLVVPVVSWLEKHVVRPILHHNNPNA